MSCRCSGGGWRAQSHWTNAILGWSMLESPWLCAGGGVDFGQGTSAAARWIKMTRKGTAKGW